MSLKSYDEMRNINVLPLCDIFVSKNEWYMSIPNCIELLHKCGAEEVSVELVDGTENDQSVTKCDQDAKNDVVILLISVDGTQFKGESALKKPQELRRKQKNTQRDVWNAQCAAFCRAVSKYTGLGADVWGEGEPGYSYIKENAQLQPGVLRQ